MLEDNNILERLEKVLISILNIEHIQIEKAMHIGNQLGENCLALSSLEYVQFILAIEEEFNVVIDYEVDMITIGNLVDYIRLYEK